MTYTQRTAVIIAPSDNAGQKEFLGYDWSNRKGHEGIQYVEPRGGKMYVETDREAEGTLAHVVRQAFGDGDVAIDGDATKYAQVVRTSDMLDFSRVSFDASVRLNVQPLGNYRNMRSKATLASILDVITERIETSQLEPALYVTTENMLQDCKGIMPFTGALPSGSVYRFRCGDILLSNIRPYLRKLWQADFDGGCSTNVFVLRVKDENICNSRYVFNVLAQAEFFDYVMLNTKGLNMPQGKREHILDYVIPLPSMSIQQQVVEECLAVDTQATSLTAHISACREQVETLFRDVEAMPTASALVFDSEQNKAMAEIKRAEVELANLPDRKRAILKKYVGVAGKYPLMNMSALCTMNVPMTEAKNYPPDTLSSFIDMASVSSNGRVTSKTDRPISELWSGSYSFFRDGDIICAKMMSSAETLKCAIADGLTNGIGFGSGEFYTFRVDPNKVLTHYVYELLNLPETREAAWASVTGTGRLRVPLKFFETLLIPLPPMDIQQRIVEECLAVDAQAASLTVQISACRERIEALLREVEAMPSVSTFAFDDKRSFSISIGKRVLNSQLIPDGKIPVFSANVRKPFGYVNELLKGFENFSQDSVLWGIDGDFMVSFRAKDTPFYPTDHCGVLRVLTDKIHPRYAARVLEREGMRLGFSRHYRASLDRVGSIKFSVPDIEAQTRTVEEVLRLEAEINQAEVELESLQERKSAILKKYL